MRVLLATADKDVASSVRRALKRSDFTPTFTGDGERAVCVAQVGCFAGLILDAVLAVVDGIETCRRLRAAGVTTPILALAEHGDPKERVRALESGADDCICRPLEIEELIARLRALIRRHHVVKSSRLVVADLVVDTAARTVSRGGRYLTLTYREFTLLEALASRQGEALARSEIQEHVWGDGFSSSNTVDVHIRNLRRKIDDGFQLKLIHTVFRRGYMLGSKLRESDSL